LKISCSTLSLIFEPRRCADPFSTQNPKASPYMPISIIPNAGACAPPCASASSPAHDAAGLSDSGSAYTYATNAPKSDTACLGYMCDDAFGNLEFRYRHGLCRCCHHQSKGKRDNPDHRFLQLRSLRNMSCPIIQALRGEERSPRLYLYS
jgi:hypothetical protein